MMARGEAPLRDDRLMAPMAFGEVARSAAFLTRLAQLAVYERIYARAEQLPVGLAEITVMTLIAENPQSRQGEIADALKIKWPRMTKLVRVLEARGLVERIVPEDDRRSVVLSLTAKGRKMTAELRPKMELLDHEVTSMLSPEEHDMLVTLLSRVIGWEVDHAG
jgi:DNA-binding MarR family transcriptional regulator